MSARTLKARVFQLALFFLLAVAGNLGLAPSASAGGPPSTFIVDSVLDAVDDNTGDGQCHAAIIDKCTLRAAVMQANVMTSTSTIILPAGTYALTIAPVTPFGADNGDLNLTTGADVINISGAGAAGTIIDADLINDRVLRVHPGRTANISGVTLRNGNVTSPNYGGGIWN